jgi:hypothetical protein
MGCEWCWGEVGGEVVVVRVCMVYREELAGCVITQWSQHTAASKFVT